MSKSSAVTPEAVIDPPTSCSLCEVPADDPFAVLTWSLEVQDDRHIWLCIECARSHVREIEGRLDIDHWAPEA